MPLSNTVLSRLTRSTFRKGAALAALATVISVPSVRATTGTWIPDANTTGWGTASNWTGGVPTVADDVANFIANLTAARTINLDGSRTLGTMTVGDPTTAFFGYTFSANGQGGVLTFEKTSGNADLTFNSASTAGSTFNLPIRLTNSLTVHALNAAQSVFNGDISGAGALNFDANNTHGSGVSSVVGQISLSGFNTFSGGLTTAEVRVAAASQYALGTGTVTVNDGGQIMIGGAGSYSNNFVLNSVGWKESGGTQFGAIRSDVNATFTGSITLGANSRLGSNATTTMLVNGVIGETGGARDLEISRAGGSAATWVFNNTNTYTGKTTVSAGTLRIGDGGATGSLGATSGVEIGNANLEIRRSDNVTVTKSITQLASTTGNLIHSGTGTLTLDNGASGYTGTTTVQGTNAKLVFGTGGAYTFAGAGAIAINNGADIEFNTSSSVTLGTVTANVANGYIIQSGSGTTTLGGAADNTLAGAIVNAGTLVLGKNLSTSAIHAVNATNNLGLIINGGTAQLGGGGGDQISTQADVQMNGGTLDLNGQSEGFDLLTGNAGIVTTGIAGTSTLTLGENNSQVNVSSPIAYNTTFGGAIQNGAGTVAVTKAGTGIQTLAGTNTYTGATTINAGVLSITGSTSLSSAVGVNSGGTLSGTGSVGAVTLATGGSIRPGATNLDTSFGVLTMDSLTVNGGDIRLNMGNEALTVTNAVNFTAASTFSPTFTTAPVIGSQPIIISGGGITGTLPGLTGVPATTRSTFALNSTGSTLELVTSGAAAKSLGWTGTGPGWNLNADVSFDSGGPEKFFNLDAVSFTDGAFNRVVNIMGTLTPSSVSVNNSAGNDYTFNSSAQAAGAIAGAGTSLTKTGNGTLFLNTANTFSGPVTITGGTIKAGTATALGDANGQTFISGGGTLDVNGQNLGAEVVRIAGTGVGGSGAIINTAAQQIQALRFLTLTGNAAVGGTGRFDVRASGAGLDGQLDLGGFTLTKTGANSFGIVGQSSGVMNVTNGNILVEQGTLQLEGTATIQGTGTLTWNAGTSALFYQTGAANITRPMVWNGITVDTLAQNSGVGSNVTVAGDATFVATGGTLTLAGNLLESGGARSIVKNNGGTLVLNGNNTLSGGFTSTAGTTQLTGTNAFAGPINLTNSTLQVLGTASKEASLGNASSISLNASTLTLNLTSNYALPATTLSNVNSSTLNFAGQTQGATLSINSALGSTTAFNTLNFGSGTTTLGSGASLTVKQVNVGQTALSSGNIGTLNVQPGASLTAAYLFMGEGSGNTGFLNQSGGSVTITASDTGLDGALRIGHWGGSSASYNLSGGTLNVLNGTTSIGVDGVNPTFNISGGTANLYRLLVDGRGATGAIGGTLNLSGGELAIGAGGLGNTGAGQVNISGGTLSASTATTWSSGMNFTNNSGTLDTRTNDVLLSGGVFGPGGFTKVGNGRLTLSSPSSFIGGTVNANAGELFVTGSLQASGVVVNVNNGAVVQLDGSGTNTGLINGTVNVNNGGIFLGGGNGTTSGKAASIIVAVGGDVRPGLSVGTLATNAFTMNGGVARFELSGTNTTTGGVNNDLIAVTGGLTFTGGSILPSFTSAPTSGNVYTLFTSTALTGLPAIDSSSTNSRLSYGIAASGNNVQLSVTGSTKALTWTGSTDGKWDVNSTQNWDAAGAEKFFQADSVAFNGGAAGTIDLAGSLQPVSTTVSGAADYTFSGTGSIDTGSLVKSGTGTLNITNVNRFTSGTTISGGVLSFANGALGSNGPITVNGGTLRWNGANTQDVSRRVVMQAAGTATFDTNGNAVFFENPVGNSTTSGLIKAGAGTLTLLGANSYTGLTNVKGGTLAVGNGTGVGSLNGASAVSIDLGATMKWDNAYTTAVLTVANPISGAGNLLLSGINDLTSTSATQRSIYDLTGNNAGLTGKVQINRAILTNVAAASDLGSATVELQDRGTIFITAGASYANNFSIEQGAGWHHNVSNADVVLGAIRLQGTTTLTGNIALNNMASIVLGDNTGANSTIGAYNTTDATLSGIISGPGDFSMSRYTAHNGGGVNIQSANIRLGGASSNTYTGKTVVDGQGSATNQASLWLEKTGGAVAIPANTVVQMGSGTTGQFNLRMGQNEQFGPGVVMNWVNASGQWGRFDLKGTTQTLAGVNSGSATTQGNGIIQNQGIDAVVPATDATLALTGGGTFLYNGLIRDQDDNGTAKKIKIIKSGSGTQTFAGASITYTGATNVDAGTLKLLDATGFNSPITVSNAGTILEIAGTANDDAGAFQSLTLNNGAKLVKANAGYFTFNSGNVTVNGNVVIDINNTAGDNQLFIGGTGNTGLTGSGTLTVNNSGSATTGLTLRYGVNASRFDGAVNVNGGALNLGNGGGLTLEKADVTLSGTRMTMNNSAFANNGATNVSVRSLAGDAASRVLLGAQTLTVGSNGTGTANTAFAGEISGAGALNKVDAGTLTLTGNNSYGATTISGTLKVGNGGTTGTLGASGITNNGSLIFDRSNTFTVNSAIGGTGALTKTGGGTMVLNSASTYSGATTISGGTLQLGAGTSLPVAAGIWLDATDGATINTSGGNVTSWTNKGSLGAIGNVSAATGREPTFVASESAMNGQPVIRFDAPTTGAVANGSVDQLANGIDFTNSNVTIIYAGRLTGGANYRLVSGVNNNWLLGTWGGNVDRAHLAQSSGFVDQGTTGSNTNAHIYGATINSGVNASFYADTVLKNSLNGGYVGPAGLSLGGGYNNSTEFSDGDIGEVLVFTSALSEEDRRSVEAYLSRKWKGTGASNVLPSTTALSLTTSGSTLNVNGVTQAVGSIAGVAGTNIQLGGGSLFTGGDNTSTNFDGAITGDGTLTKQGTGNWILGGNSIIGGNVFVNDGALQVSGSLSATAVNVGTGATLAGSGSVIGDVNIQSGGIISLGASVGQLDTGDFDLSTGAMMMLEIGGTLAGTQYDQINVSGSISLGGTLSLALVNGFTPAPGQMFWIGLNNESDSILGAFSNAGITNFGDNSGTLTAAGQDWTVYYSANFETGQVTGGNDILMVVPEPATTALLGGMGLLLAGRRRRKAQ